MSFFKKKYNRFKFLSRIIVNRLIVNYLFKKHVVNNSIVKNDITNNLNVRKVKGKSDLQLDLAHLLLHYPDFAFMFLYRISKVKGFYKWFYRVENNCCKIFKSTKIGGGVVCFHPFASVLNAQSIGENFVFRNGLTIGNKSDDNSKLPIIGINVEVGANVVIIGNISIGDNVTIGAGSVVVKDVESNVVIAGNPAKVIRIKNV